MGPASGLARRGGLSAQRLYGPGMLLFVCVFVSTVSWLGFDMIIPGLPTMTEEFAASASVSNLVLFGYLVASAVGQLLSGTVSDALGRRPVVLFGSALLAISCLLCAIAPNVAVLVVARIANGLGAGIIGTLAATLVSDSYDGATFDRNMTILQALAVVGPVAAPFLGSLMLMIASWRAIFVLFSLLGALCFFGLLPVGETLPRSERIAVNFAQTLREMARVCKGPGYLGTGMAVALMGMPMMAFLAVSSYIYLEGFGVSYLDYSLLYAVSAGAGIASPFVYLRIGKRVRQNPIALFCMGALALSGILLVAVGYRAALLLFIAVLPSFVVEAVFRSQGIVAILEGRDESRGAANSVANFLYSISSAIGTVVASLAWGNYLDGIVVITFACVAATAALWFVMSRRGTLPAKYRS